jgi:hypothetical protein
VIATNLEVQPRRSGTSSITLAARVWRSIIDPSVRVRLLLLNGERRTLDLPSGSGTVANALARLDDWIETADGGWVQKSFIVEVRPEGDSLDGDEPAVSDGE